MNSLDLPTLYNMKGTFENWSFQIHKPRTKIHFV